MPLIRLFLNLLWIVSGGVWMAIGWLLAAVIMAITIIGLPWTRAAFNIAVYTLLPFGKTAVSRADYTGRQDLGTGPLGTLGNIVWLVFGGWWLALGRYPTHRRPAFLHQLSRHVADGRVMIGVKRVA
jgi:uncharacterized membrane protein YccF (DUF307 family)